MRRGLTPASATTCGEVRRRIRTLAAAQQSSLHRTSRGAQAAKAWRPAGQSGPLVAPQPSRPVTRQKGQPGQPLGQSCCVALRPARSSHPRKWADVQPDLRQLRSTRAGRDRKSLRRPGSTSALSPHEAGQQRKSEEAAVVTAGPQGCAQRGRQWRRPPALLPSRPAESSRRDAVGIAEATVHGTP